MVDVAFTQGRGARRWCEHFGRHDDGFPGHAAVCNRAAEDLFRLAVGVHIRGIEEIDAGFERARDELVGACLIDYGNVKEARAERHRPEAQFGNAQTAVAQLPEIHDSMFAQRYDRRICPNFSRPWPCAASRCATASRFLPCANIRAKTVSRTTGTWFTWEAVPWAAPDW